MLLAVQKNPVLDSGLTRSFPFEALFAANNKKNQLLVNRVAQVTRTAHTCRLILGQGAILADHDASATAEPIDRLRAAYVHGRGTSCRARLLLTLNITEHK